MIRNLSLSLGCLILSSTCLAQNWTQVKPAKAPSARWSHGMSYDFLRGVTILFGGTASGNTYMNDTWSYDGKNWTQLQPNTVPPARRLPVLAHALTHTVMFGGSSSSGNLSDTWVWDGKDWTQIKTATSPPARSVGGMAYDSARNKMVLFGGNPNTNDTWEYDVGKQTWTQIVTKNAPSARYTNLAYDVARKRIVCYGGWRGYSADTWEYDGQDWTLMKPTKSPPGRCCHALVYDRARNRTVLFGGLTPRSSQTWEYDGNTWVQVMTTSQPSARYDFDFMVFDTRRNRMVLFGGTTNTGLSGETWEYVGSLPLTAAPATVSIASGGTQAFTLDAGTAHANRLYWIFGSVTGTSPGVTLSSLAGTVTLPLNPDFWTDITIALANSPLLTKTRGALDASGKGSASFNVPKITNQSAIGVKFYHAFLVYDAQSNFYMASNPVELTLAK